MINSQEIIERSIYDALLRVTIAMGYTIDPENYLPVSDTNAALYQAAKEGIENTNPPFIYVFGSGNALSRDDKQTPRIVVEPHGFYPGVVGIPPEILSKKPVGLGYTAYESTHEGINQYVDIHLVGKTREHIRLLHVIMYWALPNMGYIKVYTQSKLQSTNNIFLELVNFSERDTNTQGLMENIYSFKVQDVFFDTPSFRVEPELPEMIDISVLIKESLGSEILIEEKKP
jgi:hypothetical protein